MIRSNVLEFTHLGRRVLVFPAGEDGTATMVAVEGRLYGPFSTRRAAVTAVHAILELQSYRMAS